MARGWQRLASYNGDNDLMGLYLPPGLLANVASLGSALELSGTILQDSQLFKVLTADATAASGASAQPWFPSAGAVSVEGDTTYYVDGILNLSNGATTHTTGINMTGTASITSWSIRCKFTSAAINTTEPSNSAAAAGSLYTAFLQWHGTTALSTNQVLNATSTQTGAQLEIDGIIRINAAGTLIPNFQWSANPTGTNLVLKNTFFRLFKMGSGSVVSKGTWA